MKVDEEIKCTWMMKKLHLEMMKDAKLMEKLYPYQDGDDGDKIAPKVDDEW